MSTYRSSRVYRLRSNETTPTQYQQPPQEEAPPPKKKRTGLIIGIIIGIIVLIIIIIIIIVLLTRGSSTTPPVSTKCTSNANCSGSTPTCNTSTGACVGCLTSANCAAPNPICNTTTSTCVGCLVTGDCPVPDVCNTTTYQCVAPACLTNADCAATPAVPICNGGFCEQCTTDLNCSSNPLYSAANKNICNTATNMCVNCTTVADCGGPPATCVGNVCCVTNAPIITPLSLVGTNGTNSTITGSYTVTLPQTLTGAKAIFQISVPVTNEILFTTTTAASVAANGTITLTETAAGIPLYPNTSYNIAVKLVYACGATPFSTPVNMIMPSSGVNSFVSAVGASTVTIQNITGEVLASVVGTYSIGTPTFKGRVLMSQTPAFHPNNAAVIGTNLAISSGSCFTTQICSAAYKCPWAPIVPANGQTWYVIFMLDKGSSAIVPSTTDPSPPISFVYPM